MNNFIHCAWAQVIVHDLPHVTTTSLLSSHSELLVVLNEHCVIAISVFLQERLLITLGELSVPNLEHNNNKLMLFWGRKRSIKLYRSTKDCTLDKSYGLVTLSKPVCAVTMYIHVIYISHRMALYNIITLILTQSD